MRRNSDVTIVNIHAQRHSGRGGGASGRLSVRIPTVTYLSR